MSTASFGSPSTNRYKNVPEILTFLMFELQNAQRGNRTHFSEESSLKGAAQKGTAATLYNMAVRRFSFAFLKRFAKKPTSATSTNFNRHFLSKLKKPNHPDTESLNLGQYFIRTLPFYNRLSVEITIYDQGCALN